LTISVWNSARRRSASRFASSIKPRFQNDSSLLIWIFSATSPNVDKSRPGSRLNVEISQASASRRSSSSAYPRSYPSSIVYGSIPSCSWPPNYSEDDLLKAEINLSLGAFYLKRLKDGFNGNLQYALAAYNGGIYFVSFSDQNWIDKSQGDLDLFLEVIPENKKETQDYLKIITEFLNIYQLVYSRPQ